MRWLAPRAWALLALALTADAQLLLAQEPPPEAASVAPRAVPAERRARTDALEARRGPVPRRAPPGFESWARDLPPAQRRLLNQHLRRMPELRRERFFREWSRMPLHERREVAQRIARASGDARRPRELPPRLRTPEMRERLARMSPEERREFFARAQDWRELDAGERRRMRARLATFGALTADEQQALVDERFARKSPAERARILDSLREASRQMRARGEPRADAPAEPPTSE